MVERVSIRMLRLHRDIVHAALAQSIHQARRRENWARRWPERTPSPGRLLDRQGRLEPLGGVVDLYAVDPLDPLEAAFSGRNETDGEAVAVGQPLAADPGRQ